MRNRYGAYLPRELESRFPFRRDNRRPDGLWDAEDATDGNIKGTSVDRHDPEWPRWKKTPPPDMDGEFVSDEPFFDIDEITQTAKLYQPGTPLVDRNRDGNPASRQRVRDFLTGNHWRRRLLVARDHDPSRQAGASPWAIRPKSLPGQIIKGTILSDSLRTLRPLLRTIQVIRHHRIRGLFPNGSGPRPSQLRFRAPSREERLAVNQLRDSYTISIIGKSIRVRAKGTCTNHSSRTKIPTERTIAFQTMLSPATLQDRISLPH